MANILDFITNWKKANDYERIKEENKILSDRINQLREELISSDFKIRRLKISRDNLESSLTLYKIDLEKIKEFGFDALNGEVKDINSYIAKTLQGMTVLSYINTLFIKVKVAYSILPKRDTKTGRFVKK